MSGAHRGNARGGTGCLAPARVATTAPLPAYTVLGRRELKGTGTLTAGGRELGELERVIVKDEPDEHNNGLYYLADVDPWRLRRAPDLDGDVVRTGVLIPVALGELAGSIWQLRVLDDGGNPLDFGKVGDRFRFTRSTGSDDDGDPLPPATALGQVLYSRDGVNFTAETPVASDDGGWISNEDGLLLIVG